MVPSATQSATARATAACAGPNICTACLAPLMVTLLNMTVCGLAGRLGAITASSEVNPSLLLVRLLANADSAALPRGPIMRSMGATALPPPTSDSPTISFVIFAIVLLLSLVDVAGYCAEELLSRPRGPPRGRVVLPVRSQQTACEQRGYGQVRAGARV